MTAEQPPVPEQVESLVRAWEARDPAEWKSDPARFGAFGRQAIALGAPGLAFDILSEALAQYPADPALRYLSALALAKGGSSGQATRILRELLVGESGGALRSDILSLAGRVAKDRWSKLPEGAERAAAGEVARVHYRQAFEVSRDYFPGINAATMSVLSGGPDEGRRIANEVRALCLARVKTGEDDFWLCASLGEACLLLGEKDAAAEWYRQAAASAGRRFGDIASMRRQAMLLAPRVDGAAEILEILAVPRVAIFTGHMIDARHRTQARFPARIEMAVAAGIATLIAENNVGFGYCSAACGADILFAEQMLANGAEVDIVLPFRRDDFVKFSVAFAGASWVERFDRVFSRASSVSYCVEENHLGDDILYAYAAELTVGLAALRAEQLETEAVMLAVVEPDDEGRIGGTAGNVKRWEAQGRRAAVLNLREIRAGAPEPARSATPDSDFDPSREARPAGLPWGQRQIRTMLFADMVGYSKLREHETPQFFVHFLGAIEREMDASRDRPVFGNTWGDGLYLVFEDVAHGADFALRLRDAIARIEWRKAGLPADMNIRIGMHTGPVFRARDPIIKRENFFGSHVTRAARIEPVAAPGSVYVSEQTAAALAASDNRRFACDYLGPLGLAKQYGSGRIYRLRRTSESE
ncbi:MAG: TRAFs-binding domain-containing protein [Pseudomonadota bacterium]